MNCKPQEVNCGGCVCTHVCMHVHFCVYNQSCYGRVDLAVGRRIQKYSEQTHARGKRGISR